MEPTIIYQINNFINCCNLNIHSNINDLNYQTLTKYNGIKLLMSVLFMGCIYHFNYFINNINRVVQYQNHRILVYLLCVKMDMIRKRHKIDTKRKLIVHRSNCTNRIFGSLLDNFGSVMENNILSFANPSTNPNVACISCMMIV